MKTHIFTTLVAIGVAISSATSHAVSDSAVIYFTGTITASPCTVDVSSMNQTVTIPPVTDVQLRHLADVGGAASTFPNQSFNVLLKNCGSYLGSAKVSFTGTIDSDIAADNTVLKSTGSAGNVGIRIMDVAGTTALKLDGTNQLSFPLNAGPDYTLTFYAGLIAKPLTAVTAGSVTATATATITYQ